MAKKISPDFNDYSEKGLDSALKLAQLSFDHTQRLLEHQISAQRSFFEQGIKQLQDLGGTKEPAELLRLQSAYVQENLQRNLAMAQEMAAINQQFQAEVIKSLGLPAQPKEAVAAMEKLSLDVREGMEEFARRTMDLFSPPRSR
ncbi:phasin family protein [Niveibacterium sp. SC-1]|uniref:phasin family protein n=1 Tax=Niveibacterium sp. SC-1 TaxID=3135646 RepID=UPI00311DEB78